MQRLASRKDFVPGVCAPTPGVGPQAVSHYDLGEGDQGQRPAAFEGYLLSLAQVAVAL